MLENNIAIRRVLHVVCFFHFQSPLAIKAWSPTSAADTAEKSAVLSSLIQSAGGQLDGINGLSMKRPISPQSLLMNTLAQQQQVRQLVENLNLNPQQINHLLQQQSLQLLQQQQQVSLDVTSRTQLFRAVLVPLNFRLLRWTRSRSRCKTLSCVTGCRR